ncbi:MAG: SpoIIE family protein phosphatase, partial [Planctomycetes bacterium]|nr:SpoIIE family protein phosphatase [Planctomycetota bacterium]
LVLAGPVLGCLAFRIAASSVRAEARARFDDYLTERADRLRGRLLGIGEVLYALRALYLSSEAVTEAEFVTYCRELIARYPSIQALEWAPQVTGGDRGAHEAEARTAGLAGYRIRQGDGSGMLVTAAERDAYVPVRFVEPLAGNETAIGFDLASDGVRRATLDEARTSSDVRFSAPIQLVQDELSVPAVLAAIAIQHPERVTGTAVGGGFGIAVFRVCELVEEAFGPFPDSANLRMEFLLTDTGPDGSPVILERLPETTSPGEWDASREISAAGRKWQLLARPGTSFQRTGRRHYPLALGGAVMLGWELIFGLLFFLSRRAQDRSFRKESRVAQLVLDGLQEGVVVADRAGKFLVYNEAASRMVGRGARSVPLSDWSSTYGCFLPDGETPFPAEDLPLARAIRGEKTTEQVLFVRSSDLPEGAWLMIDGQPVVDARGNVVGGVILMRDVTERRKAEESIHRLSNAVEQTADVVFITTRDGRIEYVNPAFETVLGYTREEVVGQNPRVLKSGVHGPEHYRRLWETILAGKVHRSAAVNRTKRGELIHVEQTITPMKDPEGRVTHFVSVLKDMTERKRREEHEAELRLAAAVQRNLYPARSPRFSGIDVAGSVLPAEATCGDYYDFIRTADDCVSLVIGDVSGHGLGPALLMAETRAYLRTLIHDHADLGRLLGHLNHHLAADLEPGQFISLLVVRIDPRRRLATWASAGHLPAHVVDRTGVVREVLGVTGPAIGLFPEATFTARPAIALREGDVIILLTDGVTETRSPDGTFFEEENVLRVVREHLHETAGRIVEGITGSAFLFGGETPRKDDCTVVVCKVTAYGQPEQATRSPVDGAARA